MGEELKIRSKGALGIDYLAHGDPSKSGKNFGFAIAHRVQVPGEEFPHVVFDVLHAWVPGDFEHNNWEIDYEQVGDELCDYVDNFMPVEFTLDQFNSVSTLQQVRKHVQGRHFPKRISVFERNFTKAQNWQICETTKTALGMGLIHMPYYELAELEMKFLQDMGNQRVDHPTSGPVQT